MYVTCFYVKLGRFQLTLHDWLVIDSNTQRVTPRGTRNSQRKSDDSKGTFQSGHRRKTHKKNMGNVKENNIDERPDWCMGATWIFCSPKRHAMPHLFIIYSFSGVHPQILSVGFCRQMFCVCLAITSKICRWMDDLQKSHEERTTKTCSSVRFIAIHANAVLTFSIDSASMLKLKRYNVGHPH